MHKPLITISIAMIVGLVPAAVATELPEASSHGVDAATASTATSNDTHDEDPETSPRTFTAAEERALDREVEMTTRRWQAAPSFYGRERAEADLGTSRLRDLDVARFELHRHEDDDLLYRDLADDPRILEEVAGDVLSSFLKLRREAVEDALGVDSWFGERRERRSAGRDDDFATSFRPRLSPQFDVGSRNAVGIKVRLPYTRNHLFDHLSMKVRQDVETGEMRYTLKFDDGDRFYFLGAEPGSREHGDRYEVGIRLWF